MATRPADAGSSSVCKRVGWLLIIWSASVAALGAVSWVLRLWLKH